MTLPELEDYLTYLIRGYELEHNVKVSNILIYTMPLYKDGKQAGDMRGVKIKKEG